MIIRINNRNGEKIAECELYNQDFGIWYVENKENIIHVDSDIIEEETLIAIESNTDFFRDFNDEINREINTHWNQIDFNYAEYYIGD